MMREIRRGWEGRRESDLLLDGCGGGVYVKAEGAVMVYGGVAAPCWAADVELSASWWTWEGWSKGSDYR